MPKRTKFTANFLTVLIALIMTAAMSVSVSAASAEFLGADETTRGNWVGNYGNDGYMVISSGDFFPRTIQGIKVDVTGQIGYYEWWASDNNGNGYSDNEINRREKGALFRNANRANRIAGCYYAAQTLIVNIDTGNETKIVSLYMHDYDEHGRIAKVYAYDDEGGELAEPVDVDMYDMGVYLKFKISGNVYFMLENVPPPEINVCLSGIFFDSDTSESSEAVVAEEIAGNSEENPKNQTGGEDSNAKNNGSNDILILIIAVIVAAIIAIPVIIVETDKKKVKIIENN